MSDSDNIAKLHSGTDVAKVRKVSPPAIFKPKNGKERLVGGRWNMLGVAEFLERKKNWQTMDDIARFVYGSNYQTHRDNARKHIPAQRRYMLNKDTPIVTEYGPRGTIERVKIFDRTLEDDKAKFAVEIKKAKEKKEISERRYEDLQRLYLLS